MLTEHEKERKKRGARSSGNLRAALGNQIELIVIELRYVHVNVYIHTFIHTSTQTL